MPLKISCRNGHTFHVRENLAGKRIACPTCHSPIDVPGMEEETIADVATAEILDEETDDDDTEVMTKPGKKKSKKSVKKSKRKSRQGLRVVGIGLAFLGVAMILFLASLLANLFGTVNETWALVGAIGMNLSLGLEIAAMILFFWVPREAGARGILIGMVIVTVSNFLLQAVTYFVPIWFPGEALEWQGIDVHLTSRFWVDSGLMCAGVMLWMTHKVLLFTYTGRLAEYVKAEGTEHDSRRLAIQAIALPLLTAGYPVLFIICIFTWHGRIIIVIAALALFGYWILYAIRYVALMFMLREFVSE